MAHMTRLVCVCVCVCVHVCVTSSGAMVCIVYHSVIRDMSGAMCDMTRAFELVLKYLG